MSAIVCSDRYETPWGKVLLQYTAVISTWVVSEFLSKAAAVKDDGSNDAEENGCGTLSVKISQTWKPEQTTSGKCKPWANFRGS